MKATYYKPTDRYTTPSVIKAIWIITLLSITIATFYTLSIFAFKTIFPPQILIVCILLTIWCSNILRYGLKKTFETCKIQHYWLFTSLGSITVLLTLWLHGQMEFYLGNPSFRIEDWKEVTQGIWEGRLLFDILESFSIYSDNSATGIVAWIFWVIEGMIFFMAGSSAHISKPFCEQTQTWASSIRLPLDFACLKNPSAFIEALENKQYHVFQQLKVEVENPKRIRIFFHHCRVQDKYFISMDNLDLDLGDGYYSLWDIDFNKYFFIDEEKRILRYLEIDGIEAQKLIYTITQLEQTLKKREHYEPL